MGIDMLIAKMKRDISLRYVYVMMKPAELQTMIDGLEDLQRENERLENKYQTFFRELLPVAQQRDKYYAELAQLQRELDEKDDAIAYAMNQIQIKETHIRKIEAKLNYKSTIVGYSVELIEDLEKENSDLKKEIENANQ